MAILYTDLESGVDSVAASKTVTMSNPSGTIARATFNAHGYVNGDYLWFQNTNSNAGQREIGGKVWEVENATANTFDLKGAVWVAGTANFTVNVGKMLTGLNTTSPAKSMFLGGEPGSETRVKKTPNPISIGNATWTTKSVTITLAAARTLTVDNCENLWTAANASTVTRDTTVRKEGTYSAKIVTPATGTATNTKYAYYTLPATLDLSAYQNLSFKLAYTNGQRHDTYWKICLCSDTTGDTVVDTIEVGRSNHDRSNSFNSFAIGRTGGGNLGNNIASIALYSSTVNPGNSQGVFLDNIIATKTDDIDHTTLLTKSSTATWHDTEQIVPIMSIDGTTVTIDMSGRNTSRTYTLNSSSANKGYYTTGTSPETVTTYIIQPYKLRLTSSIWEMANVVTTFGTEMGVFTTNANRPKIIGGWNFTSNTQDGMTWIDANGGQPNYNSQCANFQLESFGFTRGQCYIQQTNTPDQSWKGGFITKKITFVGIDNHQSTPQHPVRSGGGAGPLRWEDINIYNSEATFTLQGNSISTSEVNSFSNLKTVSNTMTTVPCPIIDGYKIWNSQTAAAFFSSSVTLYGKNYDIRWLGTAYFQGNSSTDVWQLSIVGLTMRDVSSTSITNNGRNTVFIKDLDTTAGSIDFGGTEFYRLVNSNRVRTTAPSTGAISGRVSLYRTMMVNTNECVSNNKDDNRAYATGFNYLSQTTERKTASGIAWQMNVTSTSTRDIYVSRARMPIARIACTGNKAVTVKAWVKKSNATAIAGALYVDNTQFGISTEVRSTNKADDTNWEELSVTFTPTAATVIEVELIGWYVSATNASLYVDDVTITEAA